MRKVIFLQVIKEQWFSSIRADVLAGIVVGLALIPEALAFSFIVGVDPKVALYASFTMAVMTAFVGGRPAMISAATGAMALILVTLMANHGLQYVLAATILTGIIQFFMGVFGVARLMRFIPNSVMLGFVNALGIMIFLAQLPYLKNGSVATYAFAIVTLILVYVIPRFIRIIPAPLIAIVIMTSLAIFGNFSLLTIGDLGTMPTTLPTFFLPDIPLNFETLQIILPYALALAVVGLLESLLTAQVLDGYTKTTSNKNKESRGQGIANIVNGFFGGMAGCALIGQSIINVKSGGRGRLSTLTAGVFLLFLILVLGDVVSKIPMPVLVGVMIMVSFTTFDFKTIRFIRKAPKSESFIMITTVIVILATHNLAIGVGVGVLMSAIRFMVKSATPTFLLTGETCTITGPLFFASAEKLAPIVENFQGKKLEFDFSNSRIWDETAVTKVLEIKNQLEQEGVHVIFTGLDLQSQQLLERLTPIK